MAGDFALVGHRVRMWPGARENHAELYRKETIFLEGMGRTGEARLELVSDNALEKVFELIKRLYPASHPVENALSVALLNVGPIIHSVLVLLNTGAIEHFAHWDIHNEGTTPLHCGGRSVQSCADGIHWRFVPGGDTHRRFVVDLHRYHLRGELQENGPHS
jgi:hypothetical protein